MIKERGIIFQDWGIQAILKDEKTRTSRIIKKAYNKLCAWADYIYPAKESGYVAWWGADPGAQFVKKTYKKGLITCPYGKPGDLLYVKETFQVYDYISGDYGGQGEAGYPLKTINPKPPEKTYCIFYRADDEEGPWRSSLFMPKWAARIWLRITDIQGERLQDISIEDIIAEGISRGKCDCPHDPLRYGHYTRCPTSDKSLRLRFKSIWDSIYAKLGYPFDSNPWVWAISFERMAVTRP